jgi:tRNA dimethylallyltransferase
LKKEKNKRPFKVIKIGLIRPREELYERINDRVLAMIEDGMVAEAQKVYPMRHYNSLNTVGYKELFEYIDGNISLDEAITKIQSNTRKYMRKQVTWFKRDQDIKWFNPSETKEIIKYIDYSLALGGK